MTVQNKFEWHKDLETYLEEIAKSWVVIHGELSYSGFQKEKIYDKFNVRFGENNWLPAHTFQGEIITRNQAYLIYEESYYHFIKNNPEVKDWLVNTASEVYDIQCSNIKSGLDYNNQECEATHLQDISVRRVLTRLKLEEEGKSIEDKLPELEIFHGDHPVQIRGRNTEGFVLNPGEVPFHLPEEILEGKRGWWKKGSVEEWYQNNKVLLVNPERLRLKLSMFSTDEIILQESGKASYQTKGNIDQLETNLQFLSTKDARKRFNQELQFLEVRDAPKISLQNLLENLEPRKLPYVHNKRTLNYKTIEDHKEYTRIYNVQNLASKNPFDICEKDDTEAYSGIISHILVSTMEHMERWNKTEINVLKHCGIGKYFFEEETEPVAKQMNFYEDSDHKRFKKGDIVFRTFFEEIDKNIASVFAVFDKIEKGSYSERDPHQINQEDLMFECTGEISSFRFFVEDNGREYFSYTYIHPDKGKRTVRNLHN
jgi:hypothetical protein